MHKSPNHVRLNDKGNQLLVFVPEENAHGIPGGWQDVVALLRQQKTNPYIVDFLADLLAP